MPSITKPLQEDQLVLIGSGRTVQSLFRDSTTYVFDLVMNSKIKKTSEVTRHPTANNSYISDHVYQNNDRISFDIILTDYPLVDPRTTGFRGFSDFTLSQVGHPDTEYAQGRARRAYETLRQIKEKVILITVVAGFQSFYNCALVDMEISEDRDNHALMARLTFEQLRIVGVRNQTAVVVSIAQPVSKGTATKRALTYYEDEDLVGLTGGT